MTASAEAVTTPPAPRFQLAVASPRSSPGEVADQDACGEPCQPAKDAKRNHSVHAPVFYGTVPPPDAITIALLFACLGSLFLVAAVRARRRSKPLAIILASWALMAGAVPGALAMSTPRLPGSTGESQPYVGLFILWLFLLIPSAALLALGGVWARGRRP